jgi:hypothetical protein
VAGEPDEASHIKPDVDWLWLGLGLTAKLPIAIAPAKTVRNCRLIELTIKFTSDYNFSPQNKLEEVANKHKVLYHFPQPRETHIRHRLGAVT